MINAFKILNYSWRYAYVKRKTWLFGFYISDLWPEAEKSRYRGFPYGLRNDILSNSKQIIYFVQNLLIFSEVVSKLERNEEFCLLLASIFLKK